MKDAIESSMITPNELRIGNLVYLVNGTKKEIEKVCSVDWCGINADIDDSAIKPVWEYKGWFKGSLIGSNLSIVEPIPITEEWLVGFGIGNKEYIEVNTCGMCEGAIYYTKDLSIIVCSGCEGEMGYKKYISFDHIQYVHTLQNLYYSLTGEELDGTIN